MVPWPPSIGGMGSCLALSGELTSDFPVHFFDGAEDTAETAWPRPFRNSFNNQLQMPRQQGSPKAIQAGFKLGQ